MNKKQFLLILIGIIVLITLSAILQSVFADKTSKFGTSAGMFCLSACALFCAKDALKPSESFGVRNSLKTRYEKKGRLNEYSKLCKILLILAVGAGFLNLMIGFIETIFAYIISISAK